MGLIKGQGTFLVSLPYFFSPTFSPTPWTSGIVFLRLL
jgi:hypothetical protein